MRVGVGRNSFPIRTASFLSRRISSLRCCWLQGGFPCQCLSLVTALSGYPEPPAGSTAAQAAPRFRCTPLLPPLPGVEQTVPLRERSAEESSQGLWPGATKSVARSSRYITSSSLGLFFASARLHGAASPEKTCSSGGKKLNRFVRTISIFKDAAVPQGRGSQARLLCGCIEERRCWGAGEERSARTSLS